MGVLTKYDQIEPIYLPQKVVIFIYLHSVYCVNTYESIAQLHPSHINTFDPTWNVGRLATIHSPSSVHLSNVAWL
jgi:hypothetical protein